MHVALGHAVPPILKPTMRRLKLEDPRVVARFTKSYTDVLENKKVAERLQKIWNRAVTWYDATNADSPLSNSQQARYEIIDQQCTVAMLEAERTCRKLYTGAIPWSPEFLRLQQRHSLLQALLRRQRGHQISQYSLRRMARRLQQVSILVWSKSKLKRAFDRSRAALQSFKREQARQARHTHNEKLVESIVQASGMEAAKVLQQLIRREASRTDARIIRFALKPPFAGAVSMVQTQRLDGELDTWTAKLDMEKAISPECQKRFRQASCTDFLTPPLFERVGALGVTDFCDNVLNGRTTPADMEGISEYAVKLINQLQRPEVLRESFLDPIPSLESYQYGCNAKGLLLSLVDTLGI
jgi:hypothetical protein